MTPRRQRRGEAETEQRGIQRVGELALVDERAIKNLFDDPSASHRRRRRRVVGVANGEKRRRDGVNGEEGVKIKVAIHRKKGAGRRMTGQEGSERENSNC